MYWSAQHVRSLRHGRGGSRRCGLPVLSNRVGAAEQLIQHGVTGFLATAGDWDSFGRYLQILLEDAALRGAFRDNLRHAAVRGWDQTFADFRAACDAMLQ